MAAACSAVSHSRLCDIRPARGRGCGGRRKPRLALVVANSAAADISQEEGAEWCWKGSDEFSPLGDRLDVPPLPLPRLGKSVRVALVRHGQSTWNAAGRIQGSTNFAVLTTKGVAQAETTHAMLESDNFDVLFKSPLARSSKTADIVWGERDGPVFELPCLREVDLYSFQGLLKEEGIKRFGAAFEQWQQSPAEFQIDDHAPVRELWYRGSLAWQDVLKLPESFNTALVVAHNAVNQAMICTALGLPPTYFRRLLQSNGATTVLDISPSLDPDMPVRVTVDRLNQSPGSPLLSGAGRKTAARIVLMRHAATYGTEDGLLLGSSNEPISPLGEVHAQKTGELLMDTRVGALFSSPLSRATATADAIVTYQDLAGHGKPYARVMQDLTPPDIGDFTGMRMMDVRDQGLKKLTLEQEQQLMAQATKAWAALCQAADENGGQTVVAVAHASIIAAFMCHCLQLPSSKLGLFRLDTTGVTIVDFPDSASRGHGNVRCSNYTAHLGRWSVPITVDDVDLVCGVDGCF